MHSNLIYDVGANNGDDTAHYLERGYRVVAVEANPVLAKKVSERFSEAVTDGRLTVLNVGIWSEPGALDFWVNDDNDEHSSFVQEVGCRDGAACHRELIECRTFASILAEYGTPYYMKVDIERADIYCLTGLDPADLPQYVSIEAHILDYLSILHQLGYTGFKCVDQTTHNEPRTISNETRRGRAYRLALQKQRNLRRRLGLPVDAGPFPPGSSGPFGESTPGEWQPVEQVAYNWLHNELGHADRGTLNPLGWFDFHARLGAAAVGDDTQGGKS